MMKSGKRGTPISGAEVTNVSPHGLWLLIDGREHFLGFAQFPWFADASIRQVTRVERPSAHHLHWPDLDVDLAVESIEHPEAYPLVSQVPPDRRLQRPKAQGQARKRGAGPTRIRG